MRSKITELLSKNYRCSLEIITDETLEYFIGKLEKFIGEADEKSRLLQMVYMHEAYHSLRNSISQISKIFTELYPEQEFTQTAMKKFYETVLIRHKKNLKFARCQDSSHFAIDFILRIYGEFEIFMQTGKYSSENILFDDESNIEENIGESVYSLPLDEVLRYINGPSQAPKIQVSQDFEENMARLDKEILDFENRLAVTQPLISRPAPLCSFEFLQSLTDRYHKIRKDLLSN